MENNITYQKNILVSTFKDFHTISDNTSIDSIFRDIKEGKYRSQIEEIRSLKKDGKSEQANILKQKLLAFTPSGIFEKSRKNEQLKTYSKIVHLDIDKINNDELDNVFREIIKIPYTYACFLSPSGDGYKVFIKVNTEKNIHSEIYNSLLNLYETETKKVFDSKCKDLARLCFISYDPNMYINNEPNYFDIACIKTEPGNYQNAPIKFNNDALFNKAVAYTEKKETYYNGNRNNFIYLLASNCNRFGMSYIDAKYYISNAYDLQDEELCLSVDSAYKHHKHEFAKFANLANLQIVNNTNSDNEENTDYLLSSPFIPDSVFNTLPSILKKGCEAFTDKRERDVFLTGAISILSGCLSSIQGIYAGENVFPSLFSFIIAPAASGKGALKFSKMLADKEHDTLLHMSKEDEKLYNIEIANYRLSQRGKKKNETVGEPPEKPPFKVIFIPANSSYAKIIYHLEQNKGEGVICETEADSMGNVLKQEWGSYSDMLRKAFHHERISSSKITNNEYIEVNNPKFSIALSGTPSQVLSLISSSEDGLFSRFIFYVFKAKQEWRDVSPLAHNYNKTEHFKLLSLDVQELISFSKQHPCEIDLTTEQWEKLNKVCSVWLTKVVLFNGDDAGSIVKRFGLIFFRLAMIFTALRRFDNGEIDEKAICNDIDFENAHTLVKTYLEHSIYMYNNLPKQEHVKTSQTSSNKQAFYDSLPKEFKRNDAIELGESYQMKPRSIDNFLKSLLGEYLKKNSFGNYQKI